jgi:hypothetical protein
MPRTRQHPQSLSESEADRQAEKLSRKCLRLDSKRTVARTDRVKLEVLHDHLIHGVETFLLNSAIHEMLIAV